jgi:hypothetical protein
VGGSSFFRENTRALLINAKRFLEISIKVLQPRDRGPLKCQRAHLALGPELSSLLLPTQCVKYPSSWTV